MNSLGERVFTPRERTLSLAAVISTSFGAGLSFGIGFPLTALTFEDWQQPKWIIGLAGAAPAIALLVAIPLLPKVIMRLGTVVSIAVGCVVGALAFLALYWCSSPWAWIALRLVMSAGFALPWLAGETWINAMAPDASRGRVIAFYAMAYFSGYAVGPLVLQALGISGFLPFLASAFLTAITCLPIVIGRRLAPPYSHDGTRSFWSSIRLAPVAMVGAFISGFAEITNLSLIPNVAIAGGQSQDQSLALLSIMTIGGSLLQFPIGWLSDKASRFAILVLIVIAYVALIVTLPFALPSEFFSAAVAFFIGGTILGFYSLGLTMVGERVAAQDLAAANAAFIVVYQAGALLGPVAAGVAMTAAPVSGYVWTSVVLMAASLALILALKRREKDVQRVSMHRG